MSKPGPNDPCPCGSGKKTKKCCGTGSPPSGAGGVPTVFAGEPDPVDRLSNRVPELLRQGRVDEAEVVARRLLERYPDEPDGIERMAEVHAARGNRPQAADWYRRAARHHLERALPGDPHAHEPFEYYTALADQLEADSPPADH